MHQKQPPAKVALARREAGAAGLSWALDPERSPRAPRIAASTARAYRFRIARPPANSIAAPEPNVPGLASLPVEWLVVTALDPFHPAVRTWFKDRLGEPTAPQLDGWPLIREGRRALFAAPPASGKPRAAFLSAIDSLLRQGAGLRDETQVLYVSPLRALSNDVQKNLQQPLA